jgi:hypothetical protein
MVNSVTPNDSLGVYYNLLERVSIIYQQLIATGHCKVAIKLL